MAAKSVVFSDTDDSALHRTWSQNPTNDKKATLSLWIKFDGSVPPAQKYIYDGGSTGGVGGNPVAAWVELQLGTHTISHPTIESPGNVTHVVSASAPTIENADEWYHWLIAVDTTQTTPANRVKMYQDGAEVSYAGPPVDADYPTQNLQAGFCLNGTESFIGTVFFNGTVCINGKMAFIHLVDGQQLTPSSFTTGTGHGTIKSKTYTGSYGTNGFLLDFDGDSLEDHSGVNDNDWSGINSPTFSTDVPPSSGTDISPAAGQLSLSTVAPTVQIAGGTTIQPAAGQLSLSTFAPSLQTQILPAAGQLALSTFAPAVLQAFIKQPAQADLLLSTVAPAALQAHNRLPAGGNLILSSAAPQVQAGGSRSIVPGQGDLVLSPTAPTALQAHNRLPAGGNLALSTVAPTVMLGIIIHPSAPITSLFLSSSPPIVVASNFIFPVSGQLALSSVAPSVFKSGDLIAGAGQLELSTFAPIMSMASFQRFAKSTTVKPSYTRPPTDQPKRGSVSQGRRNNVT